MSLRVLAGALGLIGAWLLVGGAWLAAIDGSWYYAIAGIGLLAAAGLAWRASAGLFGVYAAVLLATLAWSVWESGLDWWPLAARLDVLFVVGLVLLLPLWVRALDVTAPRGLRLQRLGLAMSLGLCAVVGVSAVLRDPHAVDGALPPAPEVPVAGAEPAGGVPPGEWHAYGRTAYGQRYAPLAQITPQNVDRLEVAWHFHTGDLRGQPGDPKETTYEVTPLKVGERLYLCTPHQSVIALDATTGRQIWRYDPKLMEGLAVQHMTCRGVSYQAPRGAAAPSLPEGARIVSSRLARLPVAADNARTVPSCDAKLFVATADGRLIALDPSSGAVCAGFGGGTGQIDLWAGMPNLRPGSYYSTSPAVVTKRLVVVGGTVLDNVSTHEQSGVIRAFDVDSGALVWNWDSGNPGATTPIAPGATYTVNSPNSWSVASVDEGLGLVYWPMGNQPPDQWGGNRSPAVEKYSSSVVALELATGQVRWVFQTVHHDLWDYDVPSQPTLVDLRVGGEDVPALVQPTKQGEIFVLDRRTGRPLLPVTEVRAPQGAAAGDRSAPTQPRSALSFAPERLRGADMWGATMFDQLACRIAFHRLRYDGRFTPPSTQGTLVYPGNFGVFNWGSVAVDPQRHTVFTTPAYLAFVSRLVPRQNDSALMVNDKPPKGSLPALNENFGAPFAAQLEPFTSVLGIPCQQPPWGYVAGADLTTGKVAWKHRNGTVRDLSPLPLPFRLGVPGIGGPLLTSGGVAFYSGALDDYVRGYDAANGKQLWRSRLPAGGQATPMSYVGGDGRQYLLVVAGGHGSTGTKAGDSVIAYALPASAAH